MTRSKLDSNNLDSPDKTSHLITRFKLPEFDDDDASGWFDLVSSIYPDESPQLFAEVVSKLPKATLQAISSGAVAQAKGSLSVLRALVESITERPWQAHLQELNSMPPCTGRPSLYLARLQALANKTQLPKNHLRLRFIMAMPAAIQPTMHAFKGDLIELATLAETIFATSPTSPNFATSLNFREFNCSQAVEPDTTIASMGSNTSPFCKNHLRYGAKTFNCNGPCEFPRTSMPLKPSKND